MKANTLTGRPTQAQFRQWRQGAMADFLGPTRNPTNRRQARCRICDVVLPAGQGIAYIEFMADGYRCRDRYVCHTCEEQTRPPGALRAEPA